MLTRLFIQNFGLIDETNIDFGPGLNVLTGETGAGKSILIDALRCVLGERMDSSFIRDPKKNCQIEAVFSLDPHLLKSEHFNEFINTDENELIIQRSLAADGKGKIRVNGLTLTVGQLKNLGNHLIDFHGPHDHQLLLSKDEHVGMLDRLAQIEKLKTSYKEAFSHYRIKQQELDQLISLSQTRQRDIELLSHDVEELSSVKLTDEDYSNIQQEQIKIQNSERLFTYLQQALHIFENEDAALSATIKKLYSPLRHLNDIDEKTIAWTNELNLIQEQIDNIHSQISSYSDSLNFDEDHAEKINELSHQYKDILRKFGPDLLSARQHLEKSSKTLEQIKNFAENDAQLREQIKMSYSECVQIGQKISKARKQASNLLNETVEKELKDLGILHVRFEVRLNKTEPHAEGIDDVEFYISPNAGEELKPLAQIVSSGEAARVMLALKKALIKVDPIPVLIFDEIDAQIGGRLGSITGKKLKELANVRQTILITHLPQIASFAQHHFKVTKSVKSSRSVTSVIRLDKQAQEDEIAQMMSGQKVSDISRAHAKDMLASANKS